MHPIYECNFSALHWVFEEIILVRSTKVSSLKLQGNAKKWHVATGLYFTFLMEILPFWVSMRQKAFEKREN